jgi:isochorismate pyruvate lyase
MKKEKVESLEQARAKIDELDASLIDLIATRQFYVDQVIRFRRIKQDAATPRIDEVLVRVRQQAEEKGVDPDMIESFYTEMIQHFLRRELKEIRP